MFVARVFRDLKCLLVASPLHSKQKHRYAGREQEEADKVEPVMQVFDDLCRFGLNDLAFRDLAEEDQGGDDGAWGKVDVETPTPAVIWSQQLFWGDLKRTSFAGVSRWLGHFCLEIHGG